MTSRESFYGVISKDVGMLLCKIHISNRRTLIVSLKMLNASVKPSARILITMEAITFHFESSFISCFKAFS